MTDDDRQFCALAAGLDVVGDLWSMLLVRELLVAPADEDALLNGIPGMDRALLCDRLDWLRANGVVEGDEDGEYRLTGLGRRLDGPLTVLARWGRGCTTQD
ncbi:winged helix-turn-helix transcriptional regulator [Saccharothrix sp. NRRL B-16314]|uniref:winged helix-turn-helix transcriptional regulator n=1 Tax=Saccharothrix sp. NRRL B-16314 TaxID=1463825 RepID=UPI00068928A8|nr:winged helix-turn-helix transcriptional regulator [Saccharothrix sp. NRRL B-16314]